MSNDFLSIMSAHSDDCALVYGEFSSRSKVIARLKACKTETAQTEAEVWLWGARMVQYALTNVKGVTDKTALGVIAAEKAKPAKERATWYDKAASAARNYAFHARKEAGLIASDNRGGKREGAGRKGEAAQAASPVAAAMATAAKPEMVKPAKLPVVSNDKMTREAWFALVNDTLATLEGVGHKCENVAAADVKLLTDARARLAAKAKAGK